MNPFSRLSTACLAVATLAFTTAPARADAVTDWNTLAGDLLAQARVGTPPANRTMAIVQTAVHEAVLGAQQPSGAGSPQALEAAIAAASRVTLSRLLPQQDAAVAAAYRQAIDRLGNGPAVSAGIAAGEQAAARVLAWRADDGAGAPDAYRPHAAAGAYVPTSPVAVPQWPQRKPWLMAHAAQFRPGPPPALDSARWARDYEEVKALGAKASRVRTAEQTGAARFWEYSLPPIYHAVVRAVALAPGRTVEANARLFAGASQAMDDALIAVMDAKYHYGFWRPVTAIRNGERDGHPATERDAAWTPFIDNPGHPEYPSAHSILAGALAEVLKAEAGPGGLPELSASSPTANGATRRWKSADAFAQEVANARVWEGIHYRTSVEVGLTMGRQIGALATTRVARAPQAAPVHAAREPAAVPVAQGCRADPAASPAWGLLQAC